ncbi:ABC transporter ATP-binding protein [Rhizobium hainanense]|uniref:Multiple sugar transport system ATP-binding protein n=1 Tax=Rhizobium hainanense TaxID=52131 RepID=A0A1C3VPJ8_9HYPH|nr:sn-glycerol-3-phosphate ABC transporter ATP-binding protein UgpC [Rhizobium hainanense]SCB29701.1 multiple sugar transport system ATP-binding protein [Rhizobium hainanense]
MATLSLKEVKKTFGAVNVIKGVDLDISDREFVVFVGPSGCGKSTLLRMIAGLEDISSGDLIIDGDHANDIPPDQRGLAMVFQTYALYPHMSVKDNMGFALKLAGVSQGERDTKINEVAGLLQLGHLLDRKPKQLSGGQRQRVAIGRAMVRSPRIFLFDEPLSNLDAALRVQMRIELARLHDQLGATMIYVTHDQVEAMTLADKIVVLRDGRIEQVGAPMELYHNPVNQFVASFIGSPAMNFLPVTVSGASASGISVLLPGGADLEVPTSGAISSGATMTLGIRPEHLRIASEGFISGEIMVVERLGGHTYVYVQIAPGRLLIVETDGADSHRLHETVSLTFNASDSHLFNENGIALHRFEANRSITNVAH